MPAPASRRVPTGRKRRTALLAGAVLAVAVAAASGVAAPQAWAANFNVTNEAEFRAAIDLANANGEPSNTITLLNDVVISDPTAFPALANPVTVNTGAFTLSGANTATGITPGTSLSFGSGSLIVTGDFIGGASAPDAGNVAGGTGLAGSGTTVNVTGGSSLTGGQGGGNPTGGAAGNGGTGLVLTNGTLLNNGLISGGDGGVSVGAVSNSNHGEGGNGAILTGGNGHINNGIIRGGAATGFDHGQPGLRLLDGTLTNNGTIAGGGSATDPGLNGDAIYLTNSTIINNGTGLIRGSDATDPAGTGGNGITVLGTSASTIINHGTIRGGQSAGEPTGETAILGGVGGTGDLTIINAGTIEGSSLADRAISFNNKRAILELQAGSVINGDVFANVGFSNDILRLGGADDESFDVSAIGSAAQYRNFNIFEKTGASTWTITGIGSGQAAPWDIYEGTMLMSAGSDLGDGAVDIFGGSLAGVGTVGATTLHAGGVMAPGIPGVNNGIGTLTIDGDYTGNGGLLAIGTVLGGDSSSTDLLRINGSTSGTTNVQVTNLSGAGAQTVEGIRVVDVAGASNGAFALIGDYVFQGEQAVVGGAYAYTLQQNGISTPADGDWYLRSSLLDVGGPGGPIYQPGVPLYEAYAGVLLGLNGLPTLQQRVGNRYWGGAVVANNIGEAPADYETSQPPGAMWGRIEGRRTSLEPARATAAMAYDADQLKLQSGFDGLFVDNAAGRLFGGLNGQFGTAAADVGSFFGNGMISAQGYSLGGTLTWYDASALYIDSQAQVTWFDSDIDSDLVGSMADGNDGVGYALGAELGQRLGFVGAWTLTPQAQLVYSSVDFDGFTDPFGARVALSQGNSLLGRLGVSADQQNIWRNGGGDLVRASFYGIANLYYEFLEGTEVDVSGTGLVTEPEELWGGLGIGGTYNWAGDMYSLYGEVSANTSLANFADSYSYNGTAGVRVRW